MPNPKSLSRIRRYQRADKNQLRLVQYIVVLFRTVFRVQELFASPKKRQKLRQFRQKMQAIETDKNLVLEQIKQGKPWEGLDALHAMQERYARPEDRTRLDNHHSLMRTIRQETEALQAISKAADGDKSTAAQGYREFLSSRPSSVMAHKYLGGALRALGDHDGSLQEYRKALELAGSNSLYGASARLEIGKILHEQGQTDAAIAEIESVIDEATPKTQSLVCMAFFQLGNMLHETGQRQKAHTAWEQAAHWDTTKIIAKKVREILQSDP